MAKTQRIRDITLSGVPCKLYRVGHIDGTLGGWVVTTNAGKRLVREGMTMQKYAIAEAEETLGYSK